MKAHAGTRPLSILVVDDNVELCENVKEVLELYGHKVTTAYDGARAIEAARREHPQVVVIDIKLPGIDGVDTFKRIKEIVPDIKGIIMTGYAVEELIREAMREGARASLKKPVDIERLVGLIEAQAAD